MQETEEELEEKCCGGGGGGGGGAAVYQAFQKWGCSGTGEEIIPNSDDQFIHFYIHLGLQKWGGDASPSSPPSDTPLPAISNLSTLIATNKCTTLHV